MSISATAAVLPKIDPIIDLIVKDLAQVNQVILKQMHSDIALIPQVAHYIIAAGGRRIRPLITLLTAKAFNYQGQRHVNLAACVEFIHTATLLHDDVVDAGELRRGQPSANSVWGNEASVLVGDFLFSRAFQLMVQDQDLKVLKILSNAAACIAEGEVHQLMRLQDMTLSENDYFKIIESKTAVLFAAAVEVGCIVSHVSPEVQQKMQHFGHNLGIVFQITDDVLDYEDSNATQEKSRGQDFREGKITLPLIMALKYADSAEKDFWKNNIKSPEHNSENFQRAVQYLNQHNVFERCRRIAADYAQVALDSLVLCPPSLYRDALTNLITLTLNRTQQ